MRRLLDADGGVISVYEDLPGDEGFVIREYFDETPIIEDNKRRLNSGTNGWTPSRDLQHVGQIPNIILHHWLLEDGINFFDKNHWPAIVRKLNDPDWRWLKTIPGRA